MDVRRYTSGYLRTNRHFVLQNLPPRTEHSAWTPLLKVLLNLVQRGNPTPVPAGIAKALGIGSDDLEGLENPLPLPDEPPDWHQTIRGDELGAHYPAQEFFDQHLPAALDSDRAALWLIQPEARISDILGGADGKFRDQQVDFYLPDAQLVVEIDGDHHQQSGQFRKDAERTAFLGRHGIATVRITTRQLADSAQRNSLLKALAERIRSNLRVRQWLDGHKEHFPERSRTEQLIAAFRLQVTCIELMLSGTLDPAGNHWTLQLSSDVEPTYVTSAIEDLFDLIRPLAALMRLDWQRPILELKIIQRNRAFESSLPAIDLSVRRRWTDANLREPHVVFCRSDYITRVPGDDGQWHESDCFQIAHDAAIKYDLREETDRPHLQSLLARLFGHPDFREGQWPILESVLRRYSTIGVLPTGGGKSLCYQLPALLQPGLTIVVSPIKSLMRDQVAELSAFGVSRVTAVSGDDSPREKARKLAEFSAGRTQILLVTPERFQMSSFRDACLAADKYYSIHHAVVDEVHCLSEWGHDFRTSYLNLGNAFRRLVPNAPVVGLTATASQNALTDIQTEFNIPDDRVFYRLDLKRPNLKFAVVPIRQTHFAAALDWVDARIAKSPHATPSGIVFTPHVNGRLGCHALAGLLQERCGLEVGFFAGSRPKHFEGTDAEFDIEKQRTQDRFKSGELRLLCATKAFGMGVNKRDVRFTLHLGVPASMESLYQEAGRAGRDGTDADCIVLASAHDPELEPALTPDIRPAILRKLIDERKRDSDLKTQLWLLTNNLRSLSDEARLLASILDRLQATTDDSTQLSARDFGVDADTMEKGIHRLAQLGYVTDWTVEDFFSGRYLVDFANRSDDDVEAAIIDLARKYSGGDLHAPTLEALCQNDQEAHQIIFGARKLSRRNRHLLLLCYWCYRHFNYARRQSMKNVFDLCREYPALGQEAFRDKLENFFTINTSTILLRQFIETGMDRIADWPGLLEPLAPTGRLATGDRRRHLEELRGMITRLLESYESNIALDSISAAVRLLLDQYDDPDGSGRLMRQLQRVRSSADATERLVEFIIDVGQRAGPATRERLSRDLLETLPGRAIALLVHSRLGDEYSAHRYMNDLLPPLHQQIERIEHGLASG